jgi:hypothetical protein
MLAISRKIKEEMKETKEKGEQKKAEKQHGEFLRSLSFQKI